MTIEQKAKAYDEALERMKSWARGEHPECFTEAQKAAEFVFPELKESEDEKIRKAIKYGLDHVFTNNTTVFGVTKEQCLAWLEKQDGITKLSEEEQNRFAKGVLTSCAMSFIDYLDLHKYEGKMCVSNGECEDIENAFHNAMWDRLHRYYCKYIEKQGEQPADKVEPIIVRDFNSAFSREQVEEIDRRIEESQRMYNAKLRDAMLKVKDFPMTN